MKLTIVLAALFSYLLLTFACNSSANQTAAFVNNSAAPAALALDGTNPPHAVDIDAVGRACVFDKDIAARLRESRMMVRDLQAVEMYIIIGRATDGELRLAVKRKLHEQLRLLAASLRRLGRERTRAGLDDRV